MNTFASIVGFLMIIGIILGFIILSAGYTVEKIQKFWYETHEDIRLQSQKWVGQMICYSTYWFSEDESATNLLKVAGEYIKETGNFDASSIRDKWRELNKKNEKI
jgi:hypothetical protein